MTGPPRRDSAPRAQLKARVGDPETLSGVWRIELRRAWAAYDAFHATLATIPPGPLRARLEDVGRQLTAHLATCGAIARHAAPFAARLQRLDADAVRGELARLRDGPQGDAPADQSLLAAALEARLSSIAALQRFADRARWRLRLHVDALNEVAIRAGHLALAAAEAGEAAGRAQVRGQT